MQHLRRLQAVEAKAAGVMTTGEFIDLLRKVVFAVSVTCPSCDVQKFKTDVYTRLAPMLRMDAGDLRAAVEGVGSEH